MKCFIEVSNDGLILQKAQGFEKTPFKNGIEVDIEDYIFNNSDRFKFINGEFIEVISPPESVSIEYRFSMLEAENAKLKTELEVTQAVVDELLFGGGM